MIETKRIKINYGEGVISVTGDSRFITGFQFDYTGDAVFDWNLPDGYMVESNGHRVVAVTMKPEVECDEILCSYTGVLHITPNTSIFANIKGKRITSTLKIKSDIMNGLRGNIDGMTKPFNKMDNNLRKKR